MEGKTQKKQVKYYNLDAIIAVGYRVNSKRATAIDYDKNSLTAGAGLLQEGAEQDALGCYRQNRGRAYRIA